MEQYVEAIAGLLNNAKVCSVTEIADSMGVSKTAASRAVRELKKLNFVEHKAYGYVDLTARGEALAARLGARHEALYHFLIDVLHFDPEWADQEACRLEHQIGDRLCRRLREFTQVFVKNDGLAAEWPVR